MTRGTRRIELLSKVDQPPPLFTPVNHFQIMSSLSLGDPNMNAGTPNEFQCHSDIQEQEKRNF